MKTCETKESLAKAVQSGAKYIPVRANVIDELVESGDIGHDDVAIGIRKTQQAVGGTRHKVAMCLKSAERLVNGAKKPANPSQQSDDPKGPKKS